MNLNEIGRLIGRGVTDPAQMARNLLSLGLSARFVLYAAVAISIAGIIISYVYVELLKLSGLSEAGQDLFGLVLIEQPFLGAASQLGYVVVSAWLLARMGSAMGGKGGWQEMLTVLVAINAVMLLFNLIQIVSFLLLPGVSFILSIAALVWTVWATVIMIKTAHQFANIGQSIGLCLVVFVLSVAMMLVIVLVFGLGPAGSEYAF